MVARDGSQDPGASESGERHYLRTSPVWTVRGSAKTMWKERRSQRMQRLENEVAAGKAERAELRRRLELFEKIAAAAGATLDDPAADTMATAEPVPPTLLAAA